MKKINLFILAFASFINISWAQWHQTNGPLCGLISCFATKDSAIYAGVFEGGIYKSVDAGNSWTSLNVDIPKPDINAIIIHNNKIFAGSYTSSGIYKSDDNGLTWNACNGGLNIYYINCFASKDSMLVAGTLQNGILISTDDGANWIHASAGLSDSNITALKFIGNKLYCGNGSNGIFTFNLNNHTWSNTGLSGEYLYSINEVDSAIFVGTSSGIYKSVDNGSSWNIFSNSIISATSIFKYHTTLFVNSYSSGLFKSSDDGLTWQSQNNGLDSARINTVFLKDSIIYIAVGNYGIYKSNADSINWVQINNGLKASSIRSVAFFVNAIYANDFDRDVFISDDYGLSWNKTNSYMFTSRNCYVLKDSSLYAATDNGLFRIDKNSSTWVPINIGFSGGITSLAYWNNYLFAGTSSGSVYKSDDNGNSWYNSNLNLGSQISSIVVDSPYVYIVEQYISMHRSDDFGLSWSTIGNGAPPNPHTLFKAGDYLFASFYCSEGVYRSNDNGNNWIAKDQGLFCSFCYSYIHYENFILVAGSYGGIYYTANYGSNWYPFNDNLDCYNVKTMFFKDSLLIIGTYGCGVLTRSLTDLPASIDENNIKNDFLIFPNPASNRITIKNPDKALINIFNIQGQILKTLVAVNNYTTIDISDFAKGMYFIKVSMKKEIITKIFIKE